MDMLRGKIALGITLVVIVVIAGISLYIFRPETQEDKTGISDELYSDVLAYQQENGLFSLPEAGEHGTDIGTQIHATYLASRILDMRFSNAFNKKTQESIDNFLTSVLAKENDLLTMEAYAILIAGNGNYDTDTIVLFTQETMDSVPNPITNYEDLSKYTGYGDVANYIEMNIGKDVYTKHTLNQFGLPDEEISERIAASALLFYFLFDNAEEVKNFYPDVQAKMHSWALEDVKYPAQFFISIHALHSPYSLSASEWNDVVEPKLEELKGCKDSEYLYSIDGNKLSECSFTLSYMSRSTSGVIANE